MSSLKINKLNDFISFDTSSYIKKKSINNNIKNNSTLMI